MRNLLVLKQNATVDFEGIESALTTIVEELNKVNSLAIHDEESNKKAKELVAQSRKDWKVFDDERKDFKKAILEPYDKVDTIFKRIGQEHKTSLETLVNNSKEYEENKRIVKEKEVIDYFNELNKENWIGFDRSGINVINSKSLSSLKAEVDTFINKINVDMEVINTLDDETRVLVFVEYEKTLDLAQSQLIVSERYKQAQQYANRMNDIPEPVVEVVEEPVKEIVKANTDTRTYHIEVELTHLQDIQLRNFLQANGIKHSINEQ